MSQFAINRNSINGSVDTTFGTNGIMNIANDIQGKLVKTYLQNQSQNPDDYNEKIVMPNGLQTGNYVLKVSSPDGSVSIKLMKK